MKNYSFLQKSITSGLVAIFVAVFFAGSTAFAASPSVITNTPSTVTSSSATLSGAYNVNSSTIGGADTQFAWGPEAGSICSVGDLTNTTPLTSYPDSARTFTASISGLSASTTYCVRAFASNNTTGPAYGSLLPFTTTSGVSSSSTPSAITSSASAYGVGGGSETLRGAFNGYGATTAVEFLWGSSASSLTNSTGFVTQSGTSGTFTVTISGLSASTIYYYQAVAQSTGGTAYGNALPFTTTGSTGAGCTIDSFSATPNPINSGDAVTLAWTTVGCTSGSIDNSVGAATPIAQGSITGLLYTTTTFTLTATDGTLSPTKSVTVTVNSSGTGGTGTGGSGCSINSFTAAQPSVSYGSSTTLSWSLSSGCTSAYITPTIGTVSTGGGSINTGAIYSTTYYTLTASDGATSVNSYANVSVSGTGTGSGTTGGTGRSSCSIQSFTASPSSVTAGGTATLYWTSNCAAVAINGLGGGSPGSGSTVTQPLYASTYYNITANDYSGNIVTSQLFVGVTSGTGYGTTGYGTTGYGTTGGYGSTCTISSFNVSPATVTAGQSATISWNSYGCTGLSISGGNMYSTFEPASGSVTTGPLSGTTTFSLYGNGATSTSQQAIAYVTNSPYPYQYTCQSGSTDPSCSGQYAGTFITIPATNVGSTTARLNGIANNINTPFVGYFEYGTTASLGQATVFQNTSPVQSYNYYDTIPTYPNTTYYYRAAGQINGTIVRGNILSFTTPSSSSTAITYVGGSSSSNSGSTSSGSTTTSTATPTGVSLTITNEKDNVTVGDTVEYTVTYTNGTSKTLTNGILTLILPMGFDVTQTTQGIMVNQTTVTANIGTLAPGQTGSIFVEAKVQPNVATDQTLVTNGTLAYTLPNGTHDSAVGYVLNHASSENVLAGFALGSGFFPTTIWGWFFTIIIILIIILIARRIAKQKHDAAGHGGHGDPHGAHGAPKH